MTFRIYDAYGPFDDLPGKEDFIKKYGVDLKFSGKTNYFTKGTNGSGKSGLTNTLLKYEPNLQYISTGRYIRATVFPTYNLIGIGEYRLGKNCGGCDTISSPKNDNPETLKWIAENLPGYSIENSGMMISTLHSPITQFEEAFPEKKVICCFMDTPYEICLERIKARSGHSDDKEFKNVRSKYDMMLKHRERYISEGKTVEGINTETWETMLMCYKTIEDRYGN